MNSRKASRTGAVLSSMAMFVLATWFMPYAGASPTQDPGTRWPAHAPTPEQVMYAQPELMARALDRLAPQDPKRVDLYLIAFAGDGSENVFRNEVEYAARLFARRFGARGHTLVLENNPATLATAPLADWTNLETALAAVHQVMDPRQDILVLYLTSHGSEDHTLWVNMPPLPLDPIGASDLAGILAENDFRWKVVIVNACYSGGFIAPLRNANTLIISSASADRTSFGCGSESQITYFADAFLVHALNRTADFVAAFGQAGKLVRQWERREKLPASDPGISAGKAVLAQLVKWRASHRPGPPVPFLPASQNTTASPGALP